MSSVLKKQIFLFCCWICLTCFSSVCSFSSRFDVLLDWLTVSLTSLEVAEADLKVWPCFQNSSFCHWWSPRQTSDLFCLIQLHYRWAILFLTIQCWLIFYRYSECFNHLHQRLLKKTFSRRTSWQTTEPARYFCWVTCSWLLFHLGTRQFTHRRPCQRFWPNTRWIRRNSCPCALLIRFHRYGSALRDYT